MHSSCFYLTHVPSAPQQIENFWVSVLGLLHKMLQLRSIPSHMAKAELSGDALVSPWVRGTGSDCAYCSSDPALFFFAQGLRCFSWCLCLHPPRFTRLIVLAMRVHTSHTVHGDSHQIEPHPPLVRAPVKSSAIMQVTYAVHWYEVRHGSWM